MQQRRYKKRIFAGTVCEQIVYTAPSERAAAKEPRPRFKDETERDAHRKGIAKRHLARLVNANCTPKGYFCTLTFDREDEVEDFLDARRERDNFKRRLLYRCPDAVLFIFMGRGKSTSRIHLHMIAENVTPEAVTESWKRGTVSRIAHLREHNTTPDGQDLGTDYTAVANYCFDHWTPEQGGHYYSRAGKIKQPEEEEPTECLRDYSVDKPPVAPKGYKLVEAFATTYNYLYYRYVKIPVEQQRRRNKQMSLFRS